MQLLKREEGIVERILSNLFPPKLGFAEHEYTVEYYGRMSRRGVDNKPGYASGRVVGKAKVIDL